MKRLLGLFLFLPTAVNAVPVVPNFTQGSMTSHTETTSKVTETINSMDYSTGYQPDSSTVSTLKTRLQQVCDKPGGIDIELSETNFDHQGSWSADDVREIGRDTREGVPQDGNVCLVLAAAGV